MVLVSVLTSIRLINPKSEINWRSAVISLALKSLASDRLLEIFSVPFSVVVPVIAEPIVILVLENTIFALLICVLVVANCKNVFESTFNVALASKVKPLLPLVNLVVPPASNTNAPVPV